MSKITPDMIEAARPPADADLSHIAPDLRPLAVDAGMLGIILDPGNLNGNHDFTGIRENASAARPAASPRSQHAYQAAAIWQRPIHGHDRPRARAELAIHRRLIQQRQQARKPRLCHFSQ